MPQVLENLIHKKEIPVTIGIFITPGHRGDVYPDDLGTGNPNNRAAEYDALDDTYARFIVEEMLPEVGKSYRLTSDPAGRAIGGTSSGAICAFTVAWHRPDQFRNVISFIGSYTSIGYRPARDGQPLTAGGDLYPTLIRKNPIKPLKVFLQDGANDLDNTHGNWFLANQQMLAAFGFANAAAKDAPGPRYEVKHVWGDGGHSDVHGGSILPDVLRWIWSSPQEERPLPRMYHGAAVVNGKIYVMGGAGADNKPVASVQVYDPATGAWASRADMPTPRALFGASAVGGTIYTVGGTIRGLDRLAVVEAYDTATNTWTRRADMPTPRNALSTAVVNGKVYAIGGWGVRPEGEPPDPAATAKDFSTVEVYDPMTDTWASRPDMPTARSHMTVSAVGGKIYAIGGGLPPRSRGGPAYLSMLEVYDTATNRWASAADLPTPRGVLSSSVIDGRIYVMGGSISRGPASSAQEVLRTLRTLSVVEIYDPASGRWAKGADLATARGWFSTSVVNGKVYVVGGRSFTSDSASLEVNAAFPGIEVYTPTR